MRNIRSYRAAEVQFGDGITLFEGDIGSGKSTVLLAIEFALFGLGDTDSAHLLRHGAKDGEVELRIEVGGRPVRLLRRLKRKAKKALVDKCLIEDDGEETELTSADMKPRVLELLGYNENPDPKAKSDVFRFGVYTPQEDMRTILDTRVRMRDQRKETIRRALRIQEYRVARDNLRIVASEVDTRYREHRAASEGIDEVEDLAREAFRDLEVERVGREAVADSLEKAQVRERDAREAMDDLEDQQRRMVQAQREVEVYKAKLAEAKGDADLAEAGLRTSRSEQERRTGLKARLEALEDIPGRLTTMEEMVHRVRKLAEGHQQALREMAKLETELQRAKEAQERSEGLKEDLEAIGAIGDREGVEERVASLTAELGQLEQGRGRAQMKVDELKAEVVELNSLEGEAECPRCQQPLTEDHLRHILKSNKVALRKHTSELRELASRANRLEEQRAELAQELKEMDVRDRRRAGLEASLKDAVEEAGREQALKTMVADLDLERVTDELDIAKGEVDEKHHKELLELDAERKDLLRQLDATSTVDGDVADAEERLSRARTILEAAKGVVKDAEEQMTVLTKDFDRDSLAKAKKEHVEATRTLGGLQSELTERDARLKRAEALLLERTDRVANLKYHIHLMEHFAEVHRWLVQCIRPALEEIELEVLSMMHEEMDASARMWFERLVEDPDLNLEVDEEFAPVITQQGFDISVDALSGGERTAVAFAYRLALNGLVQRIAARGQANLLLLDEPTDGFSREQLVRMGGVLRDLPADQIVIVSHDRELRAFSNHVFVVHKVAGESRLTPAS